MSFGLTRMDAQVYILLAKKGSTKAVEIGKAFKMSKPQLYRSLKNLEGRGIVSATLEHPAKFSALPFDKALDLLAKAKMKQALEEAQRIQDERASLLANWQALSLGDYRDTSAKFMVIEGRNNIYARIQQMIAETHGQISTMTTVPSLIRADQFGLFEVGSQHPSKSKVTFRFLADLAEQDVPQMKALLNEITRAGINFEGRNPELGLRLFPRMVIRDQDEILFFIKSLPGASATEQDNACIWTNCKDLVQAFIGTFEQLWRNSTDIEKKIEDIEGGTIATKTYVLEDAEMAKKKYDEFLRSAKEEIVILTSSQVLSSYRKDMMMLKSIVERRVSVKIMVPITNQNLEAAQELSEFCEVKHVPMGYLGATMVDGKHIFQFTNQTPAKTPRSESIFYTSDLEYVERMRDMLNDMWANASAPSAATLETILRSVPFTGGYPESDSAAAERIRKEDEAKLYSKSGWYGHGIIGKAVIHPPGRLNLPDMMIHVKKIAEDAAFGGHDVVVFFLRLPTPTGQRFVPVGIINNGERSMVMEKAAYADTPAAQNLLLVKREELEIWKQGNTLFAGWTVPISLPPTKHTLPPSCILFEGVGEIRHHEGNSQAPTGQKTKFSGDAQEAFVTFVNPSLNYVGPGTDGCLAEAAGTVVTGTGNSRLPPASTMDL
jgi:sugar-specific transcriptional regulator TrmB